MSAKRSEFYITSVMSLKPSSASRGQTREIFLNVFIFVKRDAGGKIYVPKHYKNRCAGWSVGVRTLEGMMFV
jgi:hypothetical protein